MFYSAALGGFNPSKLIPFSRSIAHSLCFVLHQLGYVQSALSLGMPVPSPLDLLYHRVLGLGALPNHPRNLPSPKSYTRAGLQGIVNCSCSANLHKSILNQLSGLRRVRAGRLAGWKRTGYAQVLNEMRRDATQRNASHRNETQRNATRRNATQRNATQRDAMRCDAMPSDDTYLSYHTTTYTRYTGCLERYVEPSEASICVRDRADSPRPACSSLHAVEQSNP